MQVTAKFIFELPFPILMQGEYGSRSHQITEEIVVYAPAVEGPPWSEEPQWEPEAKHFRGISNGQPTWVARYIIMDIKRDYSSIPITGEDQKALVAKAREILHKMLTLYRWQERQLQLDVKNIEQVDYRLWYYDVAGNLIDAGPSGIQKTGAVHLTVTFPARKVDRWNDICQHLASGTMPELYESLILDAYSIVNQEPRRAVLDTATACEVFIEKFCEATSKNNPEVDAVVIKALTTGAGVLDYFHQVLKYLCKHSLKEEKEDLYQELDYLVRTNNFVKHEGLCGYNNKKGRFVDVDSKRAKEFIGAVEETIRHTKSLN
ncbi:hypothetical protein ES703_123465 [subsurface metagenome]